MIAGAIFHKQSTRTVSKPGASLLACLWVGLCLGLVLVAQDAAKEEPGARSRRLGDKAFADGMYSLAASFYGRCKEETATTDRAAHLEVCCLLISAQVRAGNAPAARREVDELAQTFEAELMADAALRHRLICHRAEVSLLEGDTAKVVTQLTELLREMPPEGENYLRALDLLGTAHARRQEWDAAEKSYALLEFAARGMPLAATVRGKKILAVVMSGTLDKARTLLGDEAATPDRNKLGDNLLYCVILVREGRRQEAQELYAKLRPMAGGPDALWHLAVRGLADACNADGPTGYGVELLLDAAHFAATEDDRQQAFRDAINGRVALGDQPGAIALGERFLRDYPAAPDAAEVRLQLARLHAAAKRVDEALQAYTRIQDDPAVAPALRLQAAREAGALLIAHRRHEEAKLRFEFIAVNATDAAVRGEGLYWLAELLYLQGRMADAAAAFQAVGRDHPDWREKALFREIQARIQLKEYPVALAELQLFIRQFRNSPLYPDALFHLARVRQFMNEVAEAREGFAKFAAAFPEHLHAPRAWFEAGELSFAAGDYAAAATAYGKLTADHPRHALAANAWYRRIFALAAAGDETAAQADAEHLIAEHADSAHAVHARYWLADNFRNRRDHAAAEAVLLDIARLSGRPAESAQALYEAATVCFAADRSEDALRHLDELSEKFPEAPVVSDGQLLRGNIHMNSNEFHKAMPFFRKAAERRPKSPLEIAAKGRLADSFYSLAWETPDGTNTQEALALYGQVLATPDLLPEIREQALYKAGRCEEDLGDRGAAVGKYLEAVYSYETDAESGYRRDPTWFVKAALAAARLYLEKDTPEAAETALSVYRRLVRLGIEPADDFRRKIEEIRDQYRLKE